MEENLPDEIKKAERESIIEQFIDLLNSQLNKLGDISFTFNTIEEMIEKQIEIEVKHIEEEHKKAGRNPNTINWAYEYPYWWSDVVQLYFRSAFIGAVISFAETTLNYACDLVDTAISPRIKLNQLRGSFPGRYRVFLDAFAETDGLTPDHWEALKGIYAVRCVIIHNGRLIPENRAKSVTEFAKIAPGIAITSGFIDIKADFCRYCLDVVDDFSTALISSVTALAKQAIAN